MIPLSETAYKCRSKKIKETLALLGKTSSTKKYEFLDKFSSIKWNDLNDCVAKRHGTFECKGCLGDEKFRVPLSYLPINKHDRAAKAIAEEKGLFRPVKRKIIEAAEEDINLLNQKYKEQYSVSFENAMKIAEKTSVRQKKAEIAKEVKENIDDQWREKAVVRLIRSVNLS